MRMSGALLPEVSVNLPCLSSLTGVLVLHLFMHQAFNRIHGRLRWIFVSTAFILSTFVKANSHVGWGGGIRFSCPVECSIHNLQETHRVSCLPPLFQ